MNLDEVNRSTLEDLASMHRSYFVTGLLSEQIGQASLAEIVLYAYGAIAACDEAEDMRRALPVLPHEGRADCETSPHFWRGVVDARGSWGMFVNRRPRRRTGGRLEYGYPYFEVRGSRLLLSRLYDFMDRFAAWEGAACPQFLEQVDADGEGGEPRGQVRLAGGPAQAAVMSLCDGARVGSYLSRLPDVESWRPLRGWSAAARGRRVVDMTKLKEVELC